MKRLISALVFAFACIVTHAGETTVKFSAGAHDRRATPVFFEVPAAVGAGPIQLKDDAGATLAVQVDDQRVACVVLPELKAGASRTYTLVTLAAKAEARALAARNGAVVDVSVNGKKVLAYQGAKTDLPAGFAPAFQRGGYIYPLFSPSGALVVDDYPPNHKHHHGIWAPWTKTEFEGRNPDFWNMGTKTGTVEVRGEPAIQSGPAFARIRATHQFVDLSATPPKAALDEVWVLTVYSLGADDAALRLVELEITQTCATDAPLKLPKFHYGGLGMRGHRDWDGKGKATFLTSEGKTIENGNATRAKWVHMGGKTAGTDAGIAVLCHPGNFRAPQPTRLHPSEPFFCYSPSAIGEWEIAPNKPYAARYRFVVTDGTVDKALIERLWNDYAHPVEVDVTSPK